MSNTPKLEDVHIWVSPVTKKVYIGTLRFEMENGYFRAKSKVDRTSEFLGAMIELLKLHGGKITVVEDDTGKKFIVRIEEVS